MNQRQRFIRKIVYACAIALLLLPLSWLSQPAAKDGSKGGILAQMRDENHLSQADLGEIDPASETIKLATLGMRGVASAILWQKANRYKAEEDWANLSATLEQLRRLEPNYLGVWVFQGWNLSYNVSVEFDDYHDRYRWVIRGIEFLKEGAQYNRDQPRLLTDIGWTIAHKIGKADEHVQFRKLFREDDDFHGSRPVAQRDNWLVGREWLLKAEQVVAKGTPVFTEAGGRQVKSPLLFYSRPPMCLVNYAETLEEEGTFGEVAKSAWKRAGDAWVEFSTRDLPTMHNMFVRLGDKESFDKKSEAAQRELARLTPEGLPDKIFQERLATLEPAEREAFDTPDDKRTKEQQGLMYSVAQKLKLTYVEVADRITGDNHAAALKAAEEAAQADLVARAIESERDIVNYNYWTLKCRIEPDDDTLAARKLMYDGDRAFVNADLIAARQSYIEGLAKWRQVLDKYPTLLKDSNLTEDLVASIGHYRSILHQVSEKFPEPFILQDVLDADAAFHAPKVPVTQEENPASQSDKPAE